MSLFYNRPDSPETAKLNKMSTKPSYNHFLNESAERRTLKRKTEMAAKEIQLANKALLKVRRAQLKQLIEDERQQYERELNSMGYSF